MSYTKDIKQKVKEKAQPLTLIGHHENVLVIKDGVRKTVDIMIRGGIFFCDLHTNDSDTYGEKQPDYLHIRSPA